jgi:rhodanese-related sulfurtransferase
MTSDNRPEVIQFTTKTENPNFDNVFDIAPAELQQVSSKVRMIDVRQPEEFVGELGHIHGAELIVLDQLPDKISNLSKNETIVFVCRSGARSGQATAFAKMNGFTHVYNMKGGMIAWNNLLLPVER